MRGKGNGHSHIAGGNINCSFSMESNLEIIFKIKDTHIFWSSNFTQGFYPQIFYICFKWTCGSIVCHCKKLETT